MKEKHSPGPWEVVKHEYGDEVWFGGEGAGMWTIEGPEGCYLAGRGPVNPPSEIRRGPEIRRDQEQAAADARLVACSPEMLNLLKRYYRYIQRIAKVEHLLPKYIFPPEVYHNCLPLPEKNQLLTETRKLLRKIRGTNKRKRREDESTTRRKV